MMFYNIVVCPRYAHSVDYDVLYLFEVLAVHMVSK